LIWLDPREKEVKKIVVPASDEALNAQLISSLRELFPECEIRLITPRENAEESDIHETLMGS